MSTNNNLNYNIIDNNIGIIPNLNSKDVVNYFELMNKLTKMIKFDINSYNDMTNNSGVPMIYNKSDNVSRKLSSVSLLNSPNTSSISSADSLTVATKGKNSTRTSNHIYKRDLFTKHKVL